MKTTLLYILQRLKEPSTYAGVAILLSTSFAFSQEKVSAVINVLVASASLAAILLQEKQNKS